MTDESLLNYQTEIDAAILRLGADRSDVEHLLTGFLEKNISLQQIPELLKKSYPRLQQLRQILRQITNEIESEIEDEPAISGYVIEAQSKVKTGHSISLEDALPPLVAASGFCADKENMKRSLILLKETQALIHTCRLEYRDAAQCYEQLANLSIEEQWRYQKEKAVALADSGREFNDNATLQEAISLLEEVVLPLLPREERTEEWIITQQTLGSVQGILGQRQGGTRNLENAITAFQGALSECNRRAAPLQWAEIHNSLGNALGALALRQGDDEMLGKSIDSFELALEEQTLDLAPQDRAVTQNNLAAILQSLGQRNKDAKVLKRAVEMFKQVLTIWTKESAPLHWASTMNNLGTALRQLGEHRKGPRTIEQSIAAYNSALSVRNRERLPQEWAMTKNNLGAALHKLGEREENAGLLEKAMSAYECTLEEWTQDKLPMAWGMTMANLAVARRSLAELAEDPVIAEKAVDELETVCDFFRHASHAHYSELSIEELAKARKLLDALNLAKGKYADLVKQ